VLLVDCPWEDYVGQQIVSIDQLARCRLRPLLAVSFGLQSVVSDQPTRISSKCRNERQLSGCQVREMDGSHSHVNVRRTDNSEDSPIKERDSVPP
jgi:hypothetical protein